MIRVRTLGLALVAVFAISAIGSASALAAPPCEKAEPVHYIYCVAGLKLEAGKTQPTEAKAKTSFVLKGEVIGVKSVTTCKKLKLAAGAVLNGGTPGKSESTTVFEECSATVGGVACKSVSVTNTAAVGELVTVVLPAIKAGKLAVEFKPKEGGVFSTIKFKECGGFGSPEAKVEGTSAALATPEKEEKVTGNLEWGAAEITKVKHSSGAENTVGLKFAGNVATLEGIAEVSLVSKAVWGVF